MSHITPVSSSFSMSGSSSGVSTREELDAPAHIDDKEKEEDCSTTSDTGLETADLAVSSASSAFVKLSDDVLFIIFTSLINEADKDQKAVVIQNLRLTSRRCYQIIEEMILPNFWEELKTNAKKPQLQRLIQEISNAAENDLNESSSSSSNPIPNSRFPSYLSRFSYLAQNFVDHGCPLEIDGKPIVFGFQAEFYDELQDRIDISLRISWIVLRKQLIHQDLFKQNELPCENERSQQIRNFLSCPQYLAKAASLTAFQINTGIIGLGYSLPKALPLTISSGSAPFSCFPRELCSFSHLKWLDLNCNSSLTSLPLEIGNLTNLEELIIYGTAIKRLPPTIGNLRSLKLLCLSKNKLTALPPAIGYLPNLNNLNVSGNQLTRLPRSISNLIGRLEHYDLSSNPWILISNYAISLKEEEYEKQRFLGPFGYYWMSPNAIFQNKGSYFTHNKYHACSSYICTSPMGALFQQLHDLASEDADLQKAFDNLPPDLQQQINDRLAIPSGSQTEGNRFADRAHFIKTVTKIVQEKLDRFEPRDWLEIYYLIYKVAGHDRDNFLTTEEARSFWELLNEQIQKPEKETQFRIGFSLCPLYDRRSNNYIEIATRIIPRALSENPSSIQQRSQQEWRNLAQRWQFSLMGLRLAPMNIIRFIDTIYIEGLPIYCG